MTAHQDTHTLILITTIARKLSSTEVRPTALLFNPAFTNVLRSLRPSRKLPSAEDRGQSTAFDLNSLIFNPRTAVTHIHAKGQGQMSLSSKVMSRNKRMESQRSLHYLPY